MSDITCAPRRYFETEEVHPAVAEEESGGGARVIRLVDQRTLLFSYVSLRRRAFENVIGDLDEDRMLTRIQPGHQLEEM